MLSRFVPISAYQGRNKVRQNIVAILQVARVNAIAEKAGEATRRSEQACRRQNLGIGCLLLDHHPPGQAAAVPGSLIRFNALCGANCASPLSISNFNPNPDETRWRLARQ